MSEEAAIAMSATLRACIREGDEYEAISRIGLRAADMIDRLAAQLAALRAGADTEDLHAAPAQSASVRRLMASSVASLAGLDAAHVAAWQRHMAARADAADRIAALEAEAETLHAAAEGWRVRAGAAETELSALKNAIADPGLLRQFILRGVINVPADLVFLYDTNGPVAEKIAEARRQALEEAAQAVESGLDDIDGCGKSKGEAEAIALMVRTMRRRAAAIRALADKPAAGGADA